MTTDNNPHQSIAKTLRFLMVALFLLMPICQVISQNNSVHKETDGMLTVEAEAFYKQSKDDIRKWYVVSETFETALKQNDPELHITGASGKKYIELLPDTRTNHDDELTPGVNFSNEAGKMAIVHYKVNFSTPGRYYVWVRAYSSGTEDNGVHVGIDGNWPESGQRMQWCEGKNSWRWESRQRTEEEHCGVSGILYLDVDTAGEHDIQFSLREDGFEMDQWIMTLDKSYNPNGDEIAESKSEPLSIWESIAKHVPDAIVLKAQDFDQKEKGFYEDGSWLAINPDERKEAEVSVVFNGPSALYDLVFFGVGENDGRSAYTFSINEFEQGSFRPPLSVEMFEEGPEYAKSFSDIQLNNGDLLSVKAHVGSADGKEFSRGRCCILSKIRLVNLIMGGIHFCSSNY
ncbi:MAG: hypothetical protein AAF361_07115 [Bacteroidota bacterium]